MAAGSPPGGPGSPPGGPGSPPVGPGRIRNFCIIAHIDHGKSTLADRFLERTGTLTEREMRDQVLDAMDLEREHGITIKAHPVRMRYEGPDGPYFLHLIDTPGHVDFRYEVSRALSACEGALLLVDASQGVEAQTLANLDLALEENLEVVPVLNKIDLPGADLRAARKALAELGFREDEVLAVSAKEGTGVEDLLRAVVERIPPPSGDAGAPLRALIFDSEYDPYLGAVVFVRVVDGAVRPGDKIRFLAAGREEEVLEVGVFTPSRRKVEVLSAGEVGYLVAGIKSAGDVRIGDTIAPARLDKGAPEVVPLSGYRDPLPMVFAGIYPIEGDRFDDLRTALEKLRLNDAALSYQPETSVALGFGFRCGFLGLLHMEIVRERIERHYEVPVLLTPPSVEYEVVLRDDGGKAAGETLRIDSPIELPSAGRIHEIREPYLDVRVYTPEEYIGAVMKLAEEKRAVFRDMKYLGTGRVVVHAEVPLAEMVVDFFDRLKSATKGYASLDYEYLGHRPGDLVRLDVLVNEEGVDALSCIVHRDKAYQIGKDLCARLKERIPRQQFPVPVQAAVGSRVIARETIRALGKNVTAKCYGGDVTRKRKLLEKQKEGKKRMKKIGRVEIPQEAFLAVLGR